MSEPKTQWQKIRGNLSFVVLIVLLVIVLLFSMKYGKLIDEWQGNPCKACEEAMSVPMVCTQLTSTTDEILNINQLTPLT